MSTSGSATWALIDQIYDLSENAVRKGAGGTSFSSGFMMEPIPSAEGSSDSAITNLDASTNPLMTNGLLWVSEKKNGNFNWSSAGLFSELRWGNAEVAFAGSTWVDGAQLAQGMFLQPGTTSCVIGGKWYIFGIVEHQTFDEYNQWQGDASYNLQVFNPVTNTIEVNAYWGCGNGSSGGSTGSEPATFPEIPGFDASPGARAQLRASTLDAVYKAGVTMRSVNVGGKMYIFQGGGAGGGGGGGVSHTIYGTVLDPSCSIVSGNTDCFTALPSLPCNGVNRLGAFGFACTAVNNIIYLIGGTATDTVYLKYNYLPSGIAANRGSHIRCFNINSGGTVPYYDINDDIINSWYDPFPLATMYLGPTGPVTAGTATGTAMSMTMQYGCAFHHALNVNGKICIFGGLWGTGLTATWANQEYNVIQMLDPETGGVTLSPNPRTNTNAWPGAGYYGKGRRGDGVGVNGSTGPAAGNVGGTAFVVGNSIVWLGGFTGSTNETPVDATTGIAPLTNISIVPSTTPTALYNSFRTASAAASGGTEGLIELDVSWNYMSGDRGSLVLACYPIAAAINNRVYYIKQHWSVVNLGYHGVSGCEIKYFDLSMNSMPMMTFQGEDLYLTASRGGPKTFIIPHPEYEGKMLRHACLEAPTRGTNVYEYQIEVKEPNHTTTIPLPSYFKHINGRGRVYVNAAEKSAWGGSSGYVNDDLTAAIIETEKPGIFNVMVTGVRKDPQAVAYSAIEDIDAPIALEDIPKKN